MKQQFFFIVLMIVAVFASCNRKETQHESSFDIAKMVEDFENYDCHEWPNCDTLPFVTDVDLLIDYCRRPNLKLAPNVERFLDSISEYTGIPVHQPEPPEDELGIVHRAVHELRRFQTGDRLYYPDKEVMEALDCMGFGLGDIWSHGGDIWYISLFYWHCFATQAALLSPNLDFISHEHSPDHQIGLLSYHEWSPCPMMTFLVCQHDNYCTIQMVDEEVNLKKIFQIEDEWGEKYYLVMSGGEDVQYGPLSAYLYKNSGDSIPFIANGVFPYQAMFDSFYETIPWETSENGDTIYKVVFSEYAINQSNKYNLSPNSFVDSLQIIYNPKKFQWDLCIRNGGEYWHRVEGSQSMYLHLDKEQPYFEVH